MGRGKNKIKKNKAGNALDNRPKISPPAPGPPQPLHPSSPFTTNAAASNPQEPGTLVFCKRGNELPHAHPAGSGATHKFKDTVVPNALVKRGEERFNKDLMIVSNKYGFVVIGIQKGLLILSHRDLKSFFLNHEAESVDLGDYFFVASTRPADELKLLALSSDERLLAVVFEFVVDHTTVELYKMADLRMPFKAFSLCYEVNSLQWRPIHSNHIMSIRSLSPGSNDGEVMIVDITKPIPDVYRHWHDYYTAAWSPHGLHVAALKRDKNGNGDADVLHILDVDKNAVLRSLGFRGGPDPVVYPYWKEYEMDSLRRDLASIVWCREKVILVVSFEVWRREKDGYVRSLNYYTAIRTDQSALTKQINDYEVWEPENGAAFRLYAINFDRVQAEKAVGEAVTASANIISEEEEQADVCFLASSTDNAVVTLDLGSMLMVSTGDPSHVASLNFKRNDGQHAGLGLLRLPTDLSTHNLDLEERADDTTHKSCLLLHISNNGRLFAHTLSWDTDPFRGNRWLLRDAEGKVKDEAEPRYYPKGDKESLKWFDELARLQEAERERERKLREEAEAKAKHKALLEAKARAEEEARKKEEQEREEKLRQEAAAREQEAKEKEERKIKHEAEQRLKKEMQQREEKLRQEEAVAREQEAKEKEERRIKHEVEERLKKEKQEREEKVRQEAREKQAKEMREKHEAEERLKEKKKEEKLKQEAARAVRQAHEQEEKRKRKAEQAESARVREEEKQKAETARRAAAEATREQKRREIKERAERAKEAEKKRQLRRDKEETLKKERLKKVPLEKKTPQEEINSTRLQTESMACIEMLQLGASIQEGGNEDMVQGVNLRSGRHMLSDAQVPGRENQKEGPRNVQKRKDAKEKVAPEELASRIETLKLLDSLDVPALPERHESLRDSDAVCDKDSRHRRKDHKDQTSASQKQSVPIPSAEDQHIVEILEELVKSGQLVSELQHQRLEDIIRHDRVYLENEELLAQINIWRAEQEERERQIERRERELERRERELQRRERETEKDVLDGFFARLSRFFGH